MGRISSLPAVAHGLRCRHTQGSAFCAEHATVSLTVNENADPRVLHDLASFLADLVPTGDRRAYRHDDEGPDDMPAHIRTALSTTSLQLSFDQGRLVLGTWQAVYLWEHRSRGSTRRLSLHLIGA